MLIFIKDTSTFKISTKEKKFRLWCLSMRDVCICMQHQQTAPQRVEGEVVVSTQQKGLWPPCQHNLFSTRDPHCSLHLFLSLPFASPPTHIYFCQLPYSCLHSTFANTQKTFLVRLDEALLSTVGTPGELVNRHTSFCRQAIQFYTEPGDTLESDLPLILVLYRDDQHACLGPGVTPHVL